MAEKILAKAEFVARSADGKERYNLTLTLEPHGGFDYGNGHIIALDRHDGSWIHSWDARYDSRFNDEKSFYENALEFVKGECREDLIIERVN